MRGLGNGTPYGKDFRPRSSRSCVQAMSSSDCGFGWRNNLYIADAKCSIGCSVNCKNCRRNGTSGVSE